MTDQERVIVIAYACHPNKGSEEGVGWGWLQMIARERPVTLITAEHNRGAVERAVAQSEWLHDRITVRAPRPGRWHYRPEGLWRAIEQSPLKPLMNFAYQAWLGAASRLAGRIVEEEDVALMHLVTFVGFRFPGRFYRLGVPFVWGPIGGMENTPWRFLPAMGTRGAAFYSCRNVINTLQKRFLAGPKRAMRAAARGGIIAATEGIRREIKRWYGQDSEVICEIGPPPVRAEAPTRRAAGEPLRLAWSGLHIPGKALPLLLKALAELPADLDWELTVLGEGPCTKAWQRKARRLGVNERIAWAGKLPRDEAVRRMGAAHLQCITSMKDLTSTVLLEAMSLGVPVVCPDHCGFSNVVTESSGIKLPMRSPGQLVEDLAAAIERLGQDERERARLAAGALERSRDFDWDKKAEALERVYRRALGEGEAADAEPAQTVREQTGSASVS